MRAVGHSQSMKTNVIKVRVEWSWNQVPAPSTCPLPLPSVPVPALGSHCKAEAPLHVLSGSGLDSISWAWFQQLQISRGPSSSGTPTCLPKQKQSAQTFFQNKTSAGVGVAGGEFPQPAPRGLGVPTGTKKARFGSKKGPRQTGQAATTEYQD